MDATYPWSILGIAPTVDEKAIRKAYALKLRETRPDENPVGFQALVEARDAALLGYADCLADNDGEEVSQPVGPESTEAASGVEVEPNANKQEDDRALSSQASTEETGLARLLQSLQELGPAKSWAELRAQWRRVFESFDEVSLDHHWFATHQILHRLVSDMRDAVREMPRATDMTRVEFTNFRNGPFGAYVDVLRDFDAHFQFSHHDTMAFDFLAPEDGFYLIESVAIALGRSKTDPTEGAVSSDVSFIPESYVKAGFSADAAMMEYYQASVRQRRYASGFSLLVAVLALPLTLYFRLHRLFAFLAGIAAIIGIFSLKADEEATGFRILAIIVYIVASLAIASQWRRLRVSALNARIDRLVAKGFTHDEIVVRLRTASRRDVFVMNACGLVVLLCWVGLRYGHDVCRFQEYCR